MINFKLSIMYNYHSFELANLIIDGSPFQGLSFF